MAKRMTALDSAHQIGPFTSLEDVLIVVGGSSSVHPKNTKSDTLSAIPQQPAIVMKTGLQHLIRRSN